MALVSGGNYSFTLEREVGADPRTYKEGVREFSESELLDQIEIFSQGDLQKIAEDNQQALRLTLIDRPRQPEIERLKKHREERAGVLKSLGPEIRAVRTEIENNRLQVRNLADLRRQLTEVQQSRPELSADLEATYKASAARKAILTDVKQAAEFQERFANQLRSLGQYLSEAEALLGKFNEEGPEWLAPVRSAVTTIHNGLLTALRLASDLEALDIRAQYGTLQERFEQENASYYQLRQEQQQINESLKKEEVLRGQIENLENLDEKLTKLLQTQLALVSKRTESRADINADNDKIFRIRLGEVDAINARHSDVVVLALTPGQQSNAYKNRLTDLLSGSRIKQREEVAEVIATRIPPSQLIDLVEEGDASQLAAAADRDIGQATRIISHLLDHPSLYDLEGEIFEDRLDVTMYDNGTPKPVEALSKGQRATALLPLVLRPSQYPLIIDQPEDDLDNSFIYHSLVQVVQKLKQERQIIFVTHNANIPVLGEADRVIVMSMQTPSLANAPRSGSVEDCKIEILELLEGGREAFQERERRYSSLLK